MAPPGADNLKWHAFLQDGVIPLHWAASVPRDVQATYLVVRHLGLAWVYSLAPSYISVPFEPLCWEPVIEETWVITKDSPTATRHFQMREKDVMIWLQKETLLFEAATKIRLKYHIPGNPPPRPSCFGYNRPHKSRAIAIKMTVISRDWFTIWMGFLSYLIVQTTTYGDKASTPLPCWYQLLLSHGFTDIWLSGLLASTICLFGTHNPRVGVFIQWTKQQVALLAVEWFLSHEIPIWFIWSKKEEDTIAANSKLAYLHPPNEVLQNALQILFQSPSLPLATLVMKRFFNLELVIQSTTLP
ncbi:hypothetical protein CPB84DRAFT_1850058 [Gymnopilus junonius]|uniref:Uncharacterized protein n=1 Tax=Gymnopilus junonius TaxID=109634 RepID=A0A9P5NJC5_GYMJU|nr:hypothetical protein CPB84DRAFT_1850058 [Gymnopilus junonius]